MTVGSFGSLIGGAWVCGNSTGTPTVNSGAVFYLQAPADPTQKWEAIALPHEPTVHRMQWVQVGTKRWDLVVQPLHGRGNKNTVGDGAKTGAGAVVLHDVPPGRTVVGVPAHLLEPKGPPAPGEPEG